ncbi:MAG TPA: biopolymer transporter ExbD [Myxococcota bacterium]|nr:biopolymer transporter ExbD [Myxococcota bacterium]HPB51374.1 biopolymer transporter ExbD [Myxococcota bacterium]HQP95475.1 biopolymer transporter ExbD [Myxococcota bacterium]
MGGVQESGNGKHLNLDLNLTPMIDLMTVLVTFLLMTAVWTNLGAMKVDQSVQKPNKEQQREQPKRFTIVLKDEGYTVKFDKEEPQYIRKITDANGTLTFDQKTLVEKIKELDLPAEQKVVVAADDKVEYNDMIGAMDACYQKGLFNIVVADAASVMAEMM